MVRWMFGVRVSDTILTRVWSRQSGRSLLDAVVEGIEGRRTSCRGMCMRMVTGRRRKTVRWKRAPR